MGYIFYTGWLLFDPQPNGTGLRPGERQQEYFRIATNPRNSTINAMGDVPVDIFHYGQTISDQLESNTTYRTLRLSQTHLLPQNDYLTLTQNGDRDRFVLYNLPYWGLSDGGAPITFAGTNVAIGVHNTGSDLNIGAGRGFRDNGLRNELNDYYGSNSVYVDSDVLYDPEDATGEIHKPYLTVWTAANEAPNGAQVYIARGTYYAPLTINRPMTLRAPVGKVVLGAANPHARMAAGPAIPRELLMDEPLAFDREDDLSDLSVPLVSYPNPFSDRTELNYSLPEATAVRVTVYDVVGNEIRTLLQTPQSQGSHSVVWDGRDKGGNPASTGLYVIKLQTGPQIRTVRVIKK